MLSPTTATLSSSLLPPPATTSTSSFTSLPPRHRRPSFCHAPSRSAPRRVALKSDSDVGPSPATGIEGLTAEEEAELSQYTAKEGSRVRVKAPLKVYHVPKVPEVDLTGMEGVLKQHVCVWKGKRISANLPFKVEFKTSLEGRGPVKFFAHLREDEIEFI